MAKSGFYGNDDTPQEPSVKTSFYPDSPADVDVVEGSFFEGNNNAYVDVETVEALVDQVTEQADVAAASAAAAASSASGAAGSASSAQTQATNAAASAAAAAGSAGSAGTSATNASNSATAAAGSASAASTSATNAANSASSASASATNASNSKDAAATSASSASTSATNAANSASSASTSATNAANSASAASTSATNAANSAASASGSASSASTSATNAANSASAAAGSASTASTAATNASTSASNASTSASNASTSATNAANSASAASASALSAANAAAGWSGTSSTSVAIGTGSKSFTASTGKLWGVGVVLQIASASAPTNYMHGIVTAYNSGTGALTVNVLDIGGSGTLADWNVTLAGTQGPQGPAGTVTDGDKGDITVSSSGTAFTIDAQAVTYAKIQNVSAQYRVLGRTSAGAGSIEEISTLPAQVMPAFTGGDVTSSAGSLALTIGNAKVTYAKIQNVSATDKLLGRATAGAGSVEEITCTPFARTILDDADAATARSTLGLGTSATYAVTYFLAASNNLSDLGNPASARSNLGLGSAATQNVSAFLQPANNLTDVSSTATARANLGAAPTANPTFTGTITLPTAAGTNYIAAGTGDGASFTTYNVKFQSWWGIGFCAPDGVVRAVLDTRDGTWNVLGGYQVNGASVYYSGGTDVAVADGGTGASDAGTARTNLGLSNANTVDIIFVIDGGGATITTGVKGYIPVDFPCTINQVTLLADQSGSIVVDILKDTYANYPPAGSIAASAKPTISSATKSKDSTLTGWTTSISAGDILGFKVDSITTCQRVTVALKVTKT